jgi:hypothetical protein
MQFMLTTILQLMAEFHLGPAHQTVWDLEDFGNFRAVCKDWRDAHDMSTTFLSQRLRIKRLRLKFYEAVLTKKNNYLEDPIE